MGIAVFTVGVSMTSIYAEEQNVRMAAGDTHSVGGYDFRFNGVEEVQGPNYTAAQGTFVITRKGEPVSQLHAEKRSYSADNNMMTEAGIDAGLTRDLFVALGEPLGKGAAWSVRLQSKPFIRWIWLGTVFMAFGGLLAASDRRYRAKSPIVLKQTVDGNVVGNRPAVNRPIGGRSVEGSPG